MEQNQFNKAGIKKCTFVTVILKVDSIGAGLTRCVESILRQTIDFKKAVEMILVCSDATASTSQSVCDRLIKKFPDNITIAQIRDTTAGLLYAIEDNCNGKYINYIDSTIQFNSKVYQEVRSAFKEFRGLSACRIPITADPTAFENSSDLRNSAELLDPSDCMVDELLGASTWVIDADNFKKHLARLLGLTVDSTILGISSILDCHEYGLIGIPAYATCTEAALLPASVSFAKNETFCNELAVLVRLENESIGRYGCVIPILQKCIIVRLRLIIYAALSCDYDLDILTSYDVSIIESLLRSVEDSAISLIEGLTPMERIACLAMKNRITYEDAIDALMVNADQLHLTWANKKGSATSFADLGDIGTVRFDFVEVEPGCVRFEGSIDTILPSNRVELLFKENGVEHRANIHRKVGHLSQTSPMIIRKGLAFSAAIPATESSDIEISILVDGVTLETRLADGKFFGLRFSSRFGYIVRSGICLYPVSKNVFHMSVGFGLPWRIMRELLYDASLLKKKRRDLLKLIPMRWNAVFYRLFNKDEHIWLVSDRAIAAGDNGECFFMYMQNHPQPNVHPVFVVNEDSPDFRRIAKVGDVVPFGSRKYQQLFLHADRIVSSAGDDIFINAFGKNRKYMKDLYEFEYVWMQHGVIKDDLSAWMCKDKKNVRIFVTSARRETESILKNHAYGYSSRELRQIGLPRFDRYDFEPVRSEKTIAYLPTWRKNLTYPNNPKTGTRDVVEWLDETEYFKRVNGLLNNEALCDLLEKNRYTLEFIVHPAMASVKKMFQGGRNITLLEDYDYKDVIMRASAVITDYSSVAFDFAYLRKPVIYYQFDEDEFYYNAPYFKGYFNYRTDGFGPVCVDQDSVVNALFDTIANNCKMMTKYSNRADDFFGTTTMSHCRLLCDAIMDTYI